MGAYTCEFNVVHKTCRCPTPHTIKCDVPTKHGGTTHCAGISDTHAPCYRMAEGLVGKHEAHHAHVFWYTSRDGGHYLNYLPEPYERIGSYRQWICPGNTP